MKEEGATKNIQIYAEHKIEEFIHFFLSFVCYFENILF